MYAIVDIETTGAYSGFHRITEVAVVHHDGAGITAIHKTLVNPGRDIPPHISALTGITTEMVVNAPTFEEVAEEILSWLNERIFIAHNAQFDYGFLHQHFRAAGINWNAPRLCTVRMGRKIVPGLRSYSLGRLAAHFGIAIADRHRAAGDAEATAKIFSILLQRDTTGEIGKMLKRGSRERTLPPNLDRQQVEQLPEAAGVYYFHNSNGEVIYVGKAVNIRRRIEGHFSGSAPEWNRSSIRSEIHSVTFQLTGTELIALILEAQEIRRLWPRYNLAQKEKRERWGILHYTDQSGYGRFVLNQLQRGSRPLLEFGTKGDAWNMMWEIVREYELCPRLCGLQNGAGACSEQASGSCNGACIGKESAATYNERMDNALHSFAAEDESVAVVDKGRKKGERSIVVVHRGKFAGFGFFHKGESIETLEDALGKINPSKENPMVSWLVHSWLSNPQSGRIVTF